jgi:hypothetical protein
MNLREPVVLQMGGFFGTLCYITEVNPEKVSYRVVNSDLEHVVEGSVRTSDIKEVTGDLSHYSEKDAKRKLVEKMFSMEPFSGERNINLPSKGQG